MAHLITLTDADTREDILFNLDTVVSIERGARNLSVITTRWGRTNVVESLDYIKKESTKSNGIDIAPDVG
tara:strand:- start:268 stop:477 length:210 start_codon:yes stop_codon:yes gene_type:complete